MPQNQDKECLGICVAMEFLVKNKAIKFNGASELNLNAIVLYDIYISRESLVKSPVILDLVEICKQTHQVYKQKLDSACETTVNQHKLLLAEEAIVRSKSELLTLLRNDRPKLETFLVLGERTRNLKEKSILSHAVIISELENGKLVLYDPNEPGVPLEFNMPIENDLLTISWQSRYPNDTQKATQTGVLIHGRGYLTALKEVTSKL
jgi:hypothetical protein